MWGDVGRCGEMWGDVGRRAEAWGGVSPLGESENDAAGIRGGDTALSARGRE